MITRTRTKLEISDRRTGKTQRILEQIIGPLTHKKYNFRFTPTSPKITEKYLIVSNKLHTGKIIKSRIPKEFHEYVDIKSYNCQNIIEPGVVYSKIFFDEFDFSSNFDWFNPYYLNDLGKTNLYFSTSLNYDITLEDIIDVVRKLTKYNPANENDFKDLDISPLYYLLFIMGWSFEAYEDNNLVDKNLLGSIIKENSNMVHMRKVNEGPVWA